MTDLRQGLIDGADVVLPDPFSLRAQSRTQKSGGKRAGSLSWVLQKDLEDIPSDQWEALAKRALVENPFYSRAYVLGAFHTIDAGLGVSALAIWSGQTLVGLFPVRHLWGISFGAQNVYQFSGTPLIDRNCAEAVVATWLEAVRDGGLPGCWKLPNIQLSGPLYELICRTAHRVGLSMFVEAEYSRPQLTRLAAGFEEHLIRVLGKSRRKEIERCLRRLREKGVLRMERTATPEAARGALEGFLTLENAGWKGRAGTAFLSREEDAKFVRAALSNGDPGCRAIVDTLLLDDRPIAASLNITSGTVLFTPKCTYCESLRNFGPGLVLEYLVIERFYQEPSFDRMDAATLANGHVIQGLWNEVVPVGTLYVGSRAKTTAAAFLNRAKVALKPAAKSVRDHIRIAAQRLSSRSK